MRLRRRDRSGETDERAAAAGAASAAAAGVGADPVVLPEADPTAAAFFDVDNTLMRGASIYYFARGLSSRGFFTTRDLLRFIAQQVRFRVAGKEMDAQGLAETREAALAFVAGKKVEDIVAFGEEIWDELMADKVYAGTVALARAHLDAGQRVWLVTATPVELAQLIARRLQLTGALGTVAEVKDGEYTGRLVGEPLHGPAKAAAVRSLAAREGLDLSRCAAYSDSANDIPMLSTVGHPMALNPDPELKAHADEHGWPVKDVRTGRKVARVAIPAAAGTGALTGAVVAGWLLRRRIARAA